MLIDNVSILKYTEELSHEIVLKKPSQEIIGVLKNTRDEKLETDLIGVNTLKFSYPQKEYYSKDLKVGKLIKLKSYQEKKRDNGEGGFYSPVFYEEEFYITDIDRIDDGKNTFKVTCKSNYILLGQKIVQGYSGIKRFFITSAELAAFDPNITYNGIKYDTYLEYENSGLLNYIMKLIPDWTLDTVGSSLGNIYREVDFNEIAILDIFTSFVPENYEVVIRFDTINKIITTSHIDDIGEDKGLIIENDQIAKKISAKTQSTDWVTKMYVYGSDNITIAPVNPTGDDYILSLNHVLNDEFMSPGLINSIEAYEAFVNNNQNSFTTLLSELNTLEEALTTLEDNKHFAENELADLRMDLDTTIIRYANSDEIPSPTTAQIVYSINEKQREIGNAYTELQEIGDTNNETVVLSESYKDSLEVYLIDGDYPLLGVLGTDYTFVDPTINGLNGVDYDKVVLTYNAYFTGTTMEEEIEAKEQEISNKVVEINALRDSLKIDANLSSAEQEELQVFIREKVYRNENITNRQELYDKGLEVMDKINSPHVEVDVDAADFLSSMKYSTEWDKVKLGNKIHVKSNVIPSEFVTMRLVGYKWELGKNTISLNLSSSNRKNEDTFELEDLLSRANNTATHISINASDYGAYVNSGERNELLSYISDKLDLSAQEAVAGHEQELSFDGGITLSNIVDDGRKIKLMNNMMVVTSDGFQTADVAITPDGVIAKKLIGEIILGTTLSIKTSDESSFVVNDSGVQISNQALTITGEGVNGVTLDTIEGMIITSDTDLQRTRMNAADGFVIETRELVTDEWSSAFEATTNGTMSATNLILNSGKFTYGGNDLISTIGGQAIIDFTGFDTITPDAGLLQGIEITDGTNITFAVDINGNVTLAGSIDWTNTNSDPSIPTEYTNTDAEAWFNSTKIDGNGIFTKNVGGNNIFGSNITTENLTDTGSTQHHVKLYKDSISIVDDTLEEIKMFLSMRDNGFGVNVPGIIFGAGDGSGNLQGFIQKDTDSFDIFYVDSPTNSVALSLDANGAYVKPAGSGTTKYEIATLDGSGVIGDNYIASASNWNNKISQAQVEGDIVMNIPRGQFDTNTNNAISDGETAFGYFYDNNGTTTLRSIVAASLSNIIDAGTLASLNSITETNIEDNAITTAKIKANSVTTAEMNVGTLSGISANLGSITAGNITGVTITGGSIKGVTYSDISDTGRFIIDRVGETNIADFKFYSGSIAEPMFEIYDDISNTSLRRAGEELIRFGLTTSLLSGTNVTWKYKNSEILTKADTITAVFG